MPDTPPDQINASSLNLTKLKHVLGERHVQFKIDAVKISPSTNSDLIAAAKQGAASGTVKICDLQTAGRGRAGRIWQSANGGSLTFSLLWRFAPEHGVPTALPLVAGLAVLRGLRQIGIDGIQLKWPNDLLYQNQKLGGILVELQPGQLQSAIIGIGLNLALPDKRALSPGSLPATAINRICQHQNPPPCRETILGYLLRALAETLHEYSTTGFTHLRDEWQNHQAFAQQTVKILTTPDSAAIEGINAGVDSHGALLLDTANGQIRILSGDVSLRAADPLH
jgi:BirA family biotin operon repressor/biotin-[acetyl-CoA-carboxylase] ligase